MQVDQVFLFPHWFKSDIVMPKDMGRQPYEHNIFYLFEYLSPIFFATYRLSEQDNHAY